MPTPGLALTSAKVPSKSVLQKYGMTRQEWLAMLIAQGGVCAICGKVPDSGRMNTDHEHVKGWSKMKAEQRKRYVRGIICHWCNRSYVGKGITLGKARAVVVYLEAYLRRRPT